MAEPGSASADNDILFVGCPVNLWLIIVAIDRLNTILR